MIHGKQIPPESGGKEFYCVYSAYCLASTFDCESMI